jgi:serine protease Do
MNLPRLLIVASLLLSALPAFAQPPRSWHPHAHEYPPGPRIGVLVENLSFKELDHLDLSYGVRVTRVVPGSPADTAGIQAGDILYQLDGAPLFSVARLQWLVERTAAGEKALLKYYRDDEQLSAEVTPGRPLGPSWPPAGSQRHWAWSEPSSYLGASLQSLTAGLREAFAVPEGTGALVSEVYEEGPAAEAGLHAGDVIIRMDKRSIRGIDDVRRVLDYFEPGEQLIVEIIRDKE